MNLLEQTVGRIALSLPGATRVFHTHNIDFCCGGRISLQQAAERAGLRLDKLIAELEALPAVSSEQRDWREASNDELIDHILTRYHDVHREQLPELIRMARRVEQVHGDRDNCPNGLADLLLVIYQEMESHMQKEEQILFPMLRRGLGAQAQGPIAVMRHEHDDHGENLEQVMRLTDDITPPKGACTTWRALYTGLREFREDLMEHIHLENNLLFERV
ncbi:iron-sulfur cluster repair protein YtfE [Halomonas sp. MCCC 1A17488]|uniref:Iron-sulfur cluster repair protein YtfE n=1 Tax=Billgrantia sulfidoxydans TaxID=2733484 RepID=A0ABX7W2Z4_9GAMM|nr:MULTISPECIES: iron-sulfur cluster repair protein YtfE [Halomonas]MCE8017090.1 iron-sulfur cluster repair protein YtfE [Halomonas sp. MCCC 1A17488]MCG3240423.1 iron-sulfur cluster repair protein YtfE [Halomonas sp. MCCC 1A17488]QPP49713.1 iron-sulfur cluster repair protein YtfE [Halomonas sp. SS10-MC5]QTP53324.1 iron-sulfur cluster repair protein YtfE [Halomonas sulfidoxydans]